ncbi:CsbD family protein [Sinimarinibacterium sp. CAU 1509]|uniref:CsbD family protein n=1 Tax=Sinimarinibacterium sp. CAU 1509 TaxID=2562283 RepID=UPI0010AD44D0|nr:CsbD family protein [Sinimarinibacterium sp. CAU 1509]TJY61176.1 CsbD family protein [Sinimarinibacterium sp. CAU 1509]
MSEKHASANITQTTGAWKQQMGAAKVTWGKLTDDELLQTEGHVQKLVGLVQERYAITRDEAAAQINGFFDKHKA